MNQNITPTQQPMIFDLNKLDQTKQFTMTFWMELHPVNIGKENNLLNVYNSARKDINYPPCQKTPWFLHTSNLIQKNEFKNNPNCQLDQNRINDDNFLGHIFGLSFNQNERNFELEIEVAVQVEKQNKIFQIEHKKFSIPYQSEKLLLFFSISIDFQHEKGITFFEAIGQNGIFQKEFKFKIVLKNAYLDKFFEIGFLENIKDNEFTFNIIDSNFFSFYFDNLSRLKLMDRNDGDYSPINLNDILNQNLVFTQKQQRDEKSQIFIDNSINKNFYYRLKPVKGKRNIFNLSQNSNKIFIDLNYGENQSFLEINQNDRIINQIIKNFQCEKMCSFMISFKNLSPDFTLINFLFNQQIYEFVFKNINLSNEFTINIPQQYDDNQAIQLLTTNQGFLLNDSKDLIIKHCFKNCHEIYQLNLSQPKCLSCQNSVLLKEEQKCIELCPYGKQNIYGVCEVVQKLENSYIQLNRINNEIFLIKITENIFNFENEKPLMKVTVFQANKKIKLKYEIQKNPKALEYRIIFDNSSFYGNININISYGQNIGSINARNYDESRNQVSYYESSFNNITIRKRDFQNRIIMIFAGNILKYSSIVLIFILLIYLIVGFQHNIIEFQGKNLLQIYSQIQSIFLFLFIDTPLSSNIYYFLYDYGGVIFYSLKKIIEDSYDYGLNRDHKNLITYQIIQKFIIYIYFFFIILIILIYCLILLFNKLKHKMSFFMRNQMMNMKQKIEYTPLIIVFFSVSSVLIPYIGDYLKNFNLSYLQIILIGIFAAFYIFLLLSFFYQYIKHKGFILNSDMKFKLSYFFVGYKNTKFCNIYEYLIFILDSLYVFLLVYYLNNFFMQITTILPILFFKIILTIFIKYDNFLDKFNNLLSQSITIIIFLLFICNELEIRRNRDLLLEAFGWLIIFLITIQTLYLSFLQVIWLINFLQKKLSTKKIDFHYSSQSYSEVSFKNEIVVSDNSNSQTSIYDDEIQNSKLAQKIQEKYFQVIEQNNSKFYDSYLEESRLPQERESTQKFNRF